MTDDRKEWVRSYTYDGAQWGFSVFARNEAEASRRLRAIGTNGKVDGELVARIPAPAYSCARSWPFVISFVETSHDRPR